MAVLRVGIEIGCGGAGVVSVIGALDVVPGKGVAIMDGSTLGVDPTNGIAVTG